MNKTPNTQFAIPHETKVEIARMRIEAALIRMENCKAREEMVTMPPFYPDPKKRSAAEMLRRFDEMMKNVKRFSPHQPEIPLPPTRYISRGKKLPFN